jgi:hypothetical protein
LPLSVILATTASAKGSALCSDAILKGLFPNPQNVERIEKDLAKEGRVAFFKQEPKKSKRQSVASFFFPFWQKSVF